MKSKPKKTKKASKAQKFCVKELSADRHSDEIMGFRKGFVHGCFTSEKQAVALLKRVSESRRGYVEYDGSVGIVGPGYREGYKA